MEIKHLDCDKKAPKPKSPLADYITYYQTLSNPGYAVLVTGPWGVGKTFQVKQLIPEEKRYYVSLYGIDSIDGIHKAVMNASIRDLATLDGWGDSLRDALDFIMNRATDQNAGIIGAFSGLVGKITDKALEERLKNKNSTTTLVFDDLERSLLWQKGSNELLGAINHYVEHEGFRVIVICHEENLTELENVKEKLFGQSISVIAEAEEAFDAFIAEFADGDKQFIQLYQHLIKEVWQQSKQSSLRILKHVINDVVRLKNVLEEKHLRNWDAINHILRFFCALDIEVRAGNLGEEKLLGRIGKFAHEVYTGGGKRPLIDANQRYSDFDIADDILDDNLIVSALIKGRYDSNEFVACLDKSSYFNKSRKTIPAWKKVLSFDDESDSYLRDAIVELREDFKNQRITDAKEILHGAAVLLFLSQIKEVDEELDQISEQMKAYIDRLLNDGKLQPKSPDEDLLGIASYGGDLYKLVGKSEAANKDAEDCFKEIESHLREKQVQSTLRICSPEQILNDITNHFHVACQTIMRFVDLPVLANIPPKNFVNAWLSCNRDEKRELDLSLKNRYLGNRLSDELSRERNWLIDVEREIEERRNNAKSFDQVRLQFFRPGVFDLIKEQKDVQESELN